jgi:hypothetical protein
MRAMRRTHARSTGDTRVGVKASSHCGLLSAIANIPHLPLSFFENSAITSLRWFPTELKEVRRSRRVSLRPSPPSSSRARESGWTCGRVGALLGVPGGASLQRVSWAMAPAFAASCRSIQNATVSLDSAVLTGPQYVTTRLRCLASRRLSADGVLSIPSSVGASRPAVALVGLCAAPPYSPHFSWPYYCW